MAAAAQAHHSLASDSAKLGQQHFTDRYGLQWEWCTDTTTTIIIIIIDYYYYYCKLYQTVVALSQI